MRVHHGISIVFNLRYFRDMKPAPQSLCYFLILHQGQQGQGKIGKGRGINGNYRKVRGSNPNYKAFFKLPIEVSIIVYRILEFDKTK